MEISGVLTAYHTFIESALSDPLFQHDDLMLVLNRHSAHIEMEIAGYSVEGREIRLLKLGTGRTKVFLWSQMHGDEPTGTMALMDLLNYLQHSAFTATAEAILSRCSLYILPMVNPDGVERFTRRNAQQIDINRDYKLGQTPEAKILKGVQEAIKPDFGFNLHDQSDLWGVKNTQNPAALSFLAPPFDQQYSLNENRIQAMQVIADVKDALTEHLKDKMGLFDDSFEPRAFGDNFQKRGTATILIEGGSIIADQQRQQVRKMVFSAILVGLQAIAAKHYLKNTVENYFSIPKNSKSLFHIMIKNIDCSGTSSDIGINQTKQVFIIDDIGDLSTMSAYKTYEGNALEILGDVIVDEPANFDLLDSGQTILSFRRGILQSKQ